MLNIKDLRETKVYQEALEEGLERGLEKGREREREDIAVRLLAEQFSPAKVAEVTGLPLHRVKALKKKHNGA